MDVLQTSADGLTVEESQEQTEVMIADTVNNVLDARDRWVQAGAEFNRLSTASIDALRGISPDMISDKELRDKFNEVRLIIRGPGGA